MVSNNNPHNILKNIEIRDDFWTERIRLIAEKVIWYQWNALNDNIPGAEPSHAVENFRIAAGESKNKFYGMVFQDSDVAKWIEAASYSLLSHPDQALEKILEDLIGLIGRAQQEDGYLNTYFTVGKPGQRWTDFSFGHELYCAGHMIEAAVAYYNVTGKRKLMDIVCRYADYIDAVIGPDENKMHVYCGHEEIELALVKLYKTTGEKRYLKLARYFLGERGKQPSFLEDEPTFGHDLSKSRWSKLDYHQAHKPVREQTEAEGHAVRAMYLYTAMADLAFETKDESLLKAVTALWNNTVSKKMYITGGIGSQGHAERFTFDYDLPNDTAYAETCAAIGLIFLANRMFLLDPDSKYADIMEKVIYNGMLSGISMDGMKYFYVNPLEVFPEAVEKRFDLDHVKPQRVPWFGCACCPPNIARLITSLGQYIYSQTDDGIYTHLYIGSSGCFVIEDRKVKIEQKSGFPWGGKVLFDIETSKNMKFSLLFRIPGWCRRYDVFINGEKLTEPYAVEKGYLKVDREWCKKDRIEINFPMSVEMISSNPNVKENAGKIALQRGPIIYCLEEIDNGDKLWNIFISDETKFTDRYDAELLNGIVTITAEAFRTDASDWKGVLYRPAPVQYEKTEIKAVPYFLWGNRGPGEMLVWIREQLRRDPS